MSSEYVTARKDLFYALLVMCLVQSFVLVTVSVLLFIQDTQ